MKQRFVELWTRINACGNPSAVYNELVSGYNNPPRAYHNINHVKECLLESDLIRNLAKNPDRMEFSIWYHDKIYDPKAHDNEERSADDVYAVIIAATLPFDFARDVRRQIILSKHDKNPESLDDKLFLDIDLSILGKPWPVFDQYEKDIREEYSFVSYDDFKKGRAGILRSFLDRPSIYHSDFFREKYQSSAEENLKKSIARLKSY